MLIQNIRVYGLKESSVGCKYPMRTHPPTEEEFVGLVKEAEVDFKRLAQLGSTALGSGHGTALQGIVVQFDMHAPVKIWVEAQRYHFLDFVSSMSTMHKLTNFDLDEIGAFNPHTSKNTIEEVKRLQKQYLDNPTRENKLELLYSAPVGLIVPARMTTNYAQLKTMYTQRKGHFLPDWADFCDFCDNLPLFNVLTGCSRGGVQ